MSGPLCKAFRIQIVLSEFFSVWSGTEGQALKSERSKHTGVPEIEPRSPAVWKTSSMTSNKKPRGFTLIELVVSLTLMAMISAAVVSALRTGLLVLDKGTDHLDRLRQTRVVVQLLNEAISGALPFTYSAGAATAPIQRLAFEGSSDHLRFVSRTSFKDGPDSIPRWIDIRWMPDAQKTAGALVLEERIVLPPSNLPDAAVYWTGRVLQADGCSFDYLDGNGNDKPFSWTPVWRPSSEQLPKAVRIRCNNESKDFLSLNPLEYAASYAAGLRLN